MDNLYRAHILDHYRNPRNYGHIDNPDLSGELENSLCGDRIGMEIKLGKENSERRIIEDIRFFGEGCAISIASTSILTDAVKGKTAEEVKKFTPDTLIDLLGITLTPVRLKCALLPLEVLHEMLRKISGYRRYADMRKKSKK